MSPEMTGSGGLILDVDRIEGPSRIPGSRNTLANLVEAPLLDACYALYDKGIRTVASSANARDVIIGEAHITLDVVTMSEANRRIVTELELEQVLLPVSDTQALLVAKIQIPVTPDTTSSEISHKALELAEMFVAQPFSWVQKFTFDQLRRMNPQLSETDLRIELSRDPDLYLDKEEGVYYLSEEQYRKAKSTPKVL